VEQSVAMHLMIHHPLWMAYLGEAYLLAGRLEDAYQRAGDALQLSRDLKQRGYEAHALRLLGEIAAQREPLESERAIAYYHQALALADELGMRPLLAHCHLGLGILYNRIGRPEQARAELSAAIDLYRAMEMTFWLERAEIALVSERERGN
jgi:tetratricopeptide (TPR) repeat protein